MMVKCRGYEGKLIYLNAKVSSGRTIESGYSPIYKYDIEILGDDGAIVKLYGIYEKAIEVVNG